MSQWEKSNIQYIFCTFNVTGEPLPKRMDTRSLWEYMLQAQERKAKQTNKGHEINENKRTNGRNQGVDAS